MKKICMLLLAALCGVLSVAAQDLIVKTDASKIEAKVTEITPDEIRYKRFSNLEGPTYLLPVASVSYIVYANGEREQFGPAPVVVPAAPQAEVAQAEVAPTVVPAARLTPAQRTTVYVPREYSIGEYYNVDGLEGIVCQLTADRQHGLLLSLDEVMVDWSGFRKPNLRLTGVNHRKSGEANMVAMAAYIAENNLSWSDFPAFAWCRAKGEGWYLPSIDELLLIGHNYNGGSRMSSNRQARSAFNDTLTEKGGKRMDRLVYYFSSTEFDEKSALTTHMNVEPPYVIEIPKTSKFLVRAVCPF